jgi:hypothetical protein
MRPIVPLSVDEHATNAATTEPIVNQASLRIGHAI